MPCTCQQPDRTPAAVGLLGAATEPFDHAFPVPAYPPASWFTERPNWLMTPDDAMTAHLAAGGDPAEPPLMKCSVDDQGRVAGYFYEHGQCLVHDSTACPRISPTFYAAFHQSHVAAEDGTLVRCGVIGNVNGHANEYAPVDVAQAHYADPDKQLMAVRAYDDDHGGYILGAMIPTATYGDVALVRRCPLSGDWRPMGPAWWSAHGIQAAAVKACEGYDCIGPTMVTRPGLPLVMKRYAAAILGGLGGVQLDEQEHSMAGETTIDLGDGIKIVRTAPTAAVVAAAHQSTPPGPQPAVTAASPPPPPPNAGGGASDAEPPAEATSESDLDARVAQLEQDVADIKDALGQIIDQMMAPAQAAAVLPAIEDEPAPTT